MNAHINPLNSKLMCAYHPFIKVLAKREIHHLHCQAWSA